MPRARSPASTCGSPVTVARTAATCSTRRCSPARSHCSRGRFGRTTASARSPGRGWPSSSDRWPAGSRPRRWAPASPAQWAGSSRSTEPDRAWPCRSAWPQRPMSPTPPRSCGGRSRRPAPDVRGSPAVQDAGPGRHQRGHRRPAPGVSVAAPEHPPPERLPGRVDRPPQRPDLPDRRPPPAARAEGPATRRQEGSPGGAGGGSPSRPVRAGGAGCVDRRLADRGCGLSDRADDRIGRGGAAAGSRRLPRRPGGARARRRPVRKDLQMGRERVGRTGHRHRVLPCRRAAGGGARRGGGGGGGGLLCGQGCPPGVRDRPAARRAR